MSLFEHGSFSLHSGATSDWRINCDDLTEADLEVLAKLIFERAKPFIYVVCPPSHRGSAANKLVRILTEIAFESGRPQAEAYVGRRARVLIVDDVMTTGASMEEKRDELISDAYEVEGFVLFARGKGPNWVTALFTLAEPATAGKE